MSEEKKDGELDLMELLQQTETGESFPDVPLDEFVPPTYEEWNNACEALLKGAPFEKKMYTKTYEGITFDPMYFRKDTEDILPKESFPGMGDFLRGANINGYIQKPWAIAQACDEILPEENNALLREEIKKGSTIYHIRLDQGTLANKPLNRVEKIDDEGTSLSTNNTPKLRTVFVRSDIYSRGGANDIQEVASVLATAVTYLRAMMDRGMTINEAAGQISFGLSMGANFFLQIAKLRAIRPIWANIIKAFGGSEDAQRIYVHGRPPLFF